MIVGLSGKRGVGKTTVANYLYDKYYYEKKSFASAIRLQAREMFNFSHEDFNDPKKKESPFQFYDWTPRDFLIDLGKFMRKYDVNYWADRVLCGRSDKSRLVIDDVRFPNELDKIIHAKGVVIRVERPEELNVYGEPLNDPSETALDDCREFYGVIRNDSTLDDLHKTVDRFMDLLKERPYGKEKMLPLS